MDKSSGTARVVPDLLKAIEILSDTTVRRSAVNRDLTKTLLTTERRLTGRCFLAIDLSPTFLNTGTTNETFQQLGKQDSFRYLLKSSASM